MKKITFLIGLVVITLSSFAQVGINTTSPDSSAVLDLSSNDKGLLIPTMTTTQREAMQASPPATGLADGLLVYDTDYKRFYFWDNSVSMWVVLNNCRKKYTSDLLDAEHVTIALTSNSNVGIGDSLPNSKLTVIGNLSIGSNTSAPTNGAYIDGQVRIGSGSGTTEELEVDGNSTVTGTVTANKFVGFGVTPIGGIIMYSGSTAGLFDGNGVGIIDTRMEGWAICNGYDTLPDLTGKFIVGADINEVTLNSDTIYKVNEEGGESYHILNINEIPSHKHSINHGHSIDDPGHHHGLYKDDGDATGTVAVDTGNDNSPANMNTKNSTTGITINNYNGNSGNSGGSLKHENRPPYYAVYYIIRIK